MCGGSDLSIFSGGLVESLAWSLAPEVTRRRYVSTVCIWGRYSLRDFGAGDDCQDHYDQEIKGVI